MNKNKNAKKRLSLIIAVIVIAAGAGAYWQFNTTKTTTTETKGDQAQTSGQTTRGTSSSRRPPLPPVQIATSIEEDVPQFLSALGTVRATNSVTITSRVEGQLMALDRKSVV